MTRIALASNCFVIVDDGDVALLSTFKWARHSQGYAVTNGGKVLMHRLILGLGSNSANYADHINGDRLDNRRTNLRVVTPVENSKYRTKVNKNNTSKHRGVFITEDGTYHAYIYSKKKKVNLGYYKTYQDAVDQRLLAEKKYGIKFYEG